MSTIRVLLVHDREYAIESLTRLIQFEKDMEIVGKARTGDEAIRLVKEVSPHVVLMDITLPDMTGFDAARQITTSDLAIQVVLLSGELSIEVFQNGMMAGARDVLAHPPEPTSLYAAIRQAYATYVDRRGRTGPLIPPPEPNPAQPRGHLIAVYSAKGGVGCTTLATNLAVKLHNKEKPVVLVDADLQFGDVPAFLNLGIPHSIADLVAPEESLDSELLDQVLVGHESGVRVLAAPPAINLAETVTPDHMRSVLVELRARLGWTIVDTPSELNDLSLAIIEESDLVLNVMTPDIPSVKRTTTFIDLLGMVGLPAEKVLLILNMVEARRGVSAKAIEERLRRQVVAEIPYDHPAVQDAINRGEALVLRGKTRPFTRGIYELVGKIRQAVDEGLPITADGEVTP